MVVVVGRGGGGDQAASGYSKALKRKRKKEIKKTSRPRSALKGETKTVCDVEKDVGHQLLDTPRLGKVRKFADGQPRC